MYTEELHELLINDIRNASSLEPSSENAQETNISFTLSGLPLPCAGCNTNACLGLSFFFFPWLRSQDCSALGIQKFLFSLYIPENVLRSIGALPLSDGDEQLRGPMDKMLCLDKSQHQQEAKQQNSKTQAKRIYISNFHARCKVETRESTLHLKSGFKAGRWSHTGYCRMAPSLQNSPRNIQYCASTERMYWQNQTQCPPNC